MVLAILLVCMQYPCRLGKCPMLIKLTSILLPSIAFACVEFLKFASVFLSGLRILQSAFFFSRSVLVLNGNGADVAKHCVPAVPTKR